MLKKILSSALALSMVFGTAAVLPEAVVSETGSIIAAQAANSGTCGKNVKWSLDASGTLTISGSGAMDDYSYASNSQAPWYWSFEDIKKVVISNGVTSIGSWAFNDCSNLTSVTMPNTVTTIGADAFRKCTSLTTVKFSSNLKTISDNAFYCCKGLKSVTVPDSVTSIGGSAFINCENFTSITIPDSVTNIGYDAFKNCGNLTIKCYSGSTAEKYANKNEIKCQLLAKPVHTHSYTSKITKAATCAEDGIRTYTCSCGNTYTETIKAPGHKYSPKVVKPTYESEGYTLHTCSVCGYSYKDSFTDKLHKHSYTSEITKSATCTEDGEKTYTCSCGDKYTEVIKKTGHKYTSKVTKAATCVKEGVKTYTCSVCNSSYTEPIKATGHKYTSKVTKAATCGKDGVKTFTCSTCGSTYTEAIKATGDHKYTAKVVKPTYDAQGYTLHTCSVCGKSYKDTYTAKLVRTSIAKASITGLKSKYYTGKALTQTPTVKLGSKTLKSGTDYTVSFSSNKAVGTATVRITGKGAYTGTAKATFKILPKKTTLKTATSPKTKQLKVTYTKVADVTGYQITYSTDKNFKTKASKNSAKLTKTISGLTKGMTYYVKVRTYRTVGGTKYYSGYSAVKAVKIK